MSELAYRLQGLVGRDRGGLRARLGQRAAVPARIMAPRLLFGGVALALVLFGLLMIYSASSIVGLTSEAYHYDPAYFLVRQAEFAAVGLVACVVLARLDYHVWQGTLLKAAWLVTVCLLVVVYTPMAGRDAYGATRWIALGPFSLQPSEFAKFTILLVGAHLAERYFAEGSLDNGEAIKLVAAGVLLPLALILWQPDKGTTGVLLLTLLVMCYLSGVSGRTIALVSVVGLAAALAYACKDEYARARILTVFDPFSDEYGSGYQLTQGFYALGSGGLGGVGLGLSRQKYKYLPMAHNDFIFAIIGEELGFVGTVGLLVAFAVLLWAGLKIAENAPDLTGRLIAAGCTSLLVIQLLLNVSGVVGVFPLSGKPVPFVSYGGSSVISCLMLVGLVLSVSLRSTLPETSYDRTRAKMRLAYDEADADGSRAGTATPRSARLAGTGTAPVARPRATRPARTPRPALTVIDGGAPGAAAMRPAQLVGRPVPGAAALTGDTELAGGGDWTRVDLGPSAADRLRGSRSRTR